MKTSQYAAPNRGSSTGSTVPSSYANERNQGYDFGPNTGGSRKPTGKTNGQKPGAEGAKTEGSEKLAPLNEVEKSTKKMNERFVELRNNIKKADGTIRTRQESIKPLFENSGITRESDPAAFKAVRLALDEIVHDVTQAHESYKEWSKDLGDYAKKSGGGFREKQKQLSNYKRLIENEARSIEELTHYLDALETRSEISEEKVDIFYDHIKEIKDKYAKLTEKITSNEDLPVEPRKKKKKSVKAESPTTPGTKGLITPSETKITSIPLPDSSSDQPSPDMQETDTVQNYNS